jgi:hypothetical protein
MARKAFAYGATLPGILQIGVLAIFPQASLSFLREARCCFGKQGRLAKISSWSDRKRIVVEGERRRKLRAPKIYAENVG